MATVKNVPVLNLIFELVSGEKRTIKLIHSKWDNGSYDLIESDVSSAMNQIISASSEMHQNHYQLFNDPPIKALEGTGVVTTKTEYTVKAL